IYNNTIVDNQSLSFLYQNNPGGGLGTGNVVKNNLFYDSNGTFSQNGGSAIDYGYNAFFFCSQIDADSTDPIASTNPFVNLASADYHLLSSTLAGLVFPAPYNTDADGKVRGQDGTWDRGAYEFP